LKELYRSLSPERVILMWVLFPFNDASFLCACIIQFPLSHYRSFAYGGDINEGIVGTPRFINPVLATSEQDEDLTALVLPVL
jgi:hypothetical protein